MTIPKRIVLCSDGTGNSANKGRGTNVFKIYEAIDVNSHRQNPSAPQQVAYYDDGVGTEQIKLLKVLGGMFGAGLTRNVKELYTSLCRVYEPGDEIYLFGFSRGAFTVRTLAGLIGCCGVINTRPMDDHGVEKTLTETELKKRVNKAYSRFRQHFRRKVSKWLRQFFGRPTAEQATAEFRRDFCVKHSVHCPGGKVSIRFMGVWDTVAAVGTPVDELTEVLNFIWPFKFPNLKLGQFVEKACHAVAIDDERRTFHPVLWDESTESKDSSRIEQVWFAGVHSNVGGGYPKQGLSLVALCWMMDKAIEQDLLFADGVYDRYQALANVDDKLYDSRSGMAIYYRYKPRDIARMCDKHGVEPKVHHSVLRRVELGTEGYAPGNLPSAFKVVPRRDTTKSMNELVERVSEGRRADQSMLLKEAKGPVRTRILAHYVFLAGTGYALWLAGKITPIDPATNWATKLVYASVAGGTLIGDRLYAVLTSRYIVLIGIVLLAVYYIGLIARRKSARIFVKFWRDKIGRITHGEPPAPA